MQKRVLITGGAGFLGSHLCERFLKEGYQVIAMDNLITGDLRAEVFHGGLSTRARDEML